MKADHRTTSVLCRLDDLADPGSRGFYPDSHPVDRPMFLVRKDGEVRAFRNRCPHTGAPLEWMPDQFLDYDGELIQCALHGALFRIADGLCLRGPCVGRSLEPVAVRVQSGWVYLEGAGEGLGPGTHEQGSRVPG